MALEPVHFRVKLCAPTAAMRRSRSAAASEASGRTGEVAGGATGETATAGGGDAGGVACSGEIESR